MADVDHRVARGVALVVEDDPAGADLLVTLLEEEGFQPAVCSDAGQALSSFEHRRPVAVLIDWVIPGGSGIELCRRLRDLDPAVPILFVSGRSDEASVSRGLDAGADDFLCKPFRRQELIARLDANLRKLAALPERREPVASRPGPPAGNDVRRVGGIEIDLDARTAAREGRPVPLGSLEFRLLEYLVRNAGVALSRDQILREVHGYDDIPTERVDLLVRRLRAKLGLAAWIRAVPGYGYRLERSGS
jgi:two-component system phosphate regulon response regulator PhoB